MSNNDINNKRNSATTEIARDADSRIQGHPMLSVVVPIDAAYVTSYSHSIVT